jgi:hypothetical protein
VTAFWRGKMRSGQILARRNDFWLKGACAVVGWTKALAGRFCKFCKPSCLQRRFSRPPYSKHSQSNVQ